MLRATIGRSLLGALIVGAIVFMAAPAAAQTGAVKGKVVDAKGEPVEGAKITIQSSESAARKHETKTNKKGEFFQIGLTPGNYKVSAEKEKLFQSYDVRIRLGDPITVNFALVPGAAAVNAEEAAKKSAALRAAFDEGVALSQAGKNVEAIAKFNEVIGIAPSCATCFANIGSIHLKANEFDQAEAAYKKALEVDAELAAAYTGLMNVYNAQRKFDEAEKMAAEAAKRSSGGAGGGGNPDALYNQGVVQWNANKFPEAQQAFESAIKADPNHAEAHFMLGKVYINLGKLAESATEFETYLTLAPDGPNAKEAKTNYEALKAYIKK
ncbi:MAG TPA: tetratricopeptide repeat protein [Vicinamibacterales bacterium]|nr:tetratricopeptide repeat protein [Vicinamibacterales bacterium]